MKMPRFPLLFGLLTLPLCALPAQAQNTTGGMTTILDEEPSGSGWNAVQADAAAQNEGTGHPYYHSTVLEHQTFEGDYTPSRRMVLAIFSDDGCDVTVDGTKVWAGQDKPQALPKLDESLHKLGVTLEPNTKHHIKVDYSNVIYAGGGDTDGVTLFAYEKTVPYVSLDTAQSPVTATFKSPNGIDAKSIKFIFNGVDQTANTTRSSSSLTYTVPKSVNILSCNSIRVEVADNDGNLAVGAVSANFFSPGGAIQGWSQNSTVSYSLTGSETVRVRVCLWGTDTASRTYTTTQGPGEVSTTWDGLDNSGSKAQVEVYVCKVEKLVNGNWLRIADIDPGPTDYARLRVDGALLTDENDNATSIVRKTNYPAYTVKAKGTSYLMVPLEQTADTLLGLVQNSKVVDYDVVSDTVKGTYDYDALPDGQPRDSNTLPNQFKGVTYWWLRDVFRLRKSVGTNTINADAKQSSEYTGKKDAQGRLITIPVFNITTGIAGATVTPVIGQMAFRGRVNANIMAYSFDDGPYDNAGPDITDTFKTTRNVGQGTKEDRGTTQELLGVLHDYNVKATFFTTGAKIGLAKAFGSSVTVDIISGTGHELANHTWDHPAAMDQVNQYANGSPTSADWVRSELIRTRLMERYTVGATAGNTYWYRPPGGAGAGYASQGKPYIIQESPSNNNLDFWTTIGEAGYKVVVWGGAPPGEPATTLAGTDQNGHPYSTDASIQAQAQKIIDFLEKHATRGDIVLMHNGREHTVVALKTVLPDLESASFGSWRFDTVSRVNPVFHTDVAVPPVDADGTYY